LICVMLRHVCAPEVVYHWKLNGY